MARKQTVTGGKWRKSAGLKPIACDLPPEDYETVRAAVFHGGYKSMSAFAREAVVEAAKKIVEKKGK